MWEWGSEPTKKRKEYRNRMRGKMKEKEDKKEEEGKTEKGKKEEGGRLMAQGRRKTKE